jgi:hypothetical protein
LIESYGNRLLEREKNTLKKSTNVFAVRGDIRYSYPTYLIPNIFDEKIHH